MVLVFLICIFFSQTWLMLKAKYQISKTPNFIKQLHLTYENRRDSPTENCLCSSYLLVKRLQIKQSQAHVSMEYFLFLSSKDYSQQEISSLFLLTSCDIISSAGLCPSNDMVTENKQNLVNIINQKKILSVIENKICLAFFTLLDFSICSAQASGKDTRDQHNKGYSMLIFNCKIRLLLFSTSTAMPNIKENKNQIGCVS